MTKTTLLAFSALALAIGCTDKGTDDTGGTDTDTDPTYPAASIDSSDVSCSDETAINVSITTTGRIASAGVYIVDAGDPSCTLGDGGTFADGYTSGIGDCWEEEHTMSEDSYADDESSATYSVTLSITGDYTAATDGTTLFKCEDAGYTDPNSVSDVDETQWIFYGYDLWTDEYVCLEDGPDSSIVADVFVCE